MNYQEVINIASKFDAKGFKQADTALGKLAGTAKKVAGGLGLAFGAQAIASYGKAAAKAFAEDEAAALRLNRAVENLGIGFANPAIADYISKLEKSAAVADDILRPAFQGLLTTTGSLVQSQKLLNDAITISRASGIDLATVTEDLGKGYIGITKGLTKYNTGLTRAELQSKSFSEILGVILKRSAGAAEDYLDTTSYKFNVLSVASSNASEVIGGSLVDAFALVGGGTDASDAAYAIETIATALSKIIVQSGRTIGVIPTLIKNLKNLGKNIFFGFAGAQLGVNINAPDKKDEVKLTLTEIQQQKLLDKLEREALKREKERLALLNKQNSAKKLQGVIDKANLALGKATDVFDLDKIQIAAALTNQAEQLGKTSSSAQMIQIANDTARLNVKKSINDLEDAIASKDEKAIIAATKRLEADVKNLDALTGQNTQLATIKSILEGLQPKKLIDLANLEAALAMLKQISGGSSASASTSTMPTAPAGFMPALSRYGTPLGGGTGSTALSNKDLQYLEDLNQFQYGDLFANGKDPFGLNAQPSAVPINITVNTGVGDPNAIAEAIDNVLREARQRGTLVALP